MYAFWRLCKKRYIGFVLRVFRATRPLNDLTRLSQDNAEPAHRGSRKRGSRQQPNQGTTLKDWAMVREARDSAENVHQRRQSCHYDFALHQETEIRISRIQKQLHAYASVCHTLNQHKYTSYMLTF